MFLRDMAAPPAWMIPDGSSDSTGLVFEYEDILGRTWYRLMENAASNSRPHFRVDAKAFPDGCCIKWFSKDAGFLRVRSWDDLLRNGSGTGIAEVQNTRIVRREMISPLTLQNGVHLGLMDPSRGSVFVRITPQQVAKDSWYVFESARFTGLQSIWLLVAGALSLLTGGVLACVYAKTGKFPFAAAALCLAFLMGAVVFDQPHSGSDGLIDAGDDSYYLAYAQNLIVQRAFFNEPTALAFGARHVLKNHGLPGTGLFLAPAAVVQSLWAGEPVKRPIDLNGLRAMRLLSATYSLAAMILLCASFHGVRPRIWNVVFPAFLLWGTSLSKWTFQRSIFTHSIEMALLCAVLWVLVWIWRKPTAPLWKGAVLGSCLGGAFLVRGEYLLAIPLVPLLLSRAVRQERRFFLMLCAGYGVVVAACGGCYVGWVGRISTGYGNIQSPQSQIFSGGSSLAAVFARLAGQMLDLFRSYWASGFVLACALLTFAAASIWMARREKTAPPLPVSWWGLGGLALAFFLSNACFHTPLGMEWQHRYSLKLYPLAFWVIWLGTDALPVRWKRPANAALALVFLASLFRQMQSFCHNNLSNMRVQETGLFLWTDEQLALEGMRSPYGLAVVVGLALFACGMAVMFAYRSRRIRLIQWTGLAMVLLCPALFTWVAGCLSARPDRGGLSVRHYDDADLMAASGRSVQPALDVWQGPARPLWNADKRASSSAGTGWLLAPTSDDYVFYAQSKDGLRLYLDGKILLDNWRNRTWTGSGRQVSCFLEKGFHAVRVEHCQLSGEGGFRVKWCGGRIAPNTILGEPYLQRANGAGRAGKPPE